MILCVALGVLVYSVRRYREHALEAQRPVDENVPFAVGFVGLRNDHELQELGAANHKAATKELANIVRRVARTHGCFEARRVDAGTVMVVSKTATGLVRFAESVMAAVVMETAWRNKVLTHAIGAGGSGGPASGVFLRWLKLTMLRTFDLAKIW